MIGMIPAVMPELQLVGLAAQRQPEDLVPQANPKDRLLALELLHVLDRICRAAPDRPARSKRRRRPGSCASTSSAEVFAGTTVTLQPSRVSMRRMFSLMPKS